MFSSVGSCSRRFFRSRRSLIYPLFVFIASTLILYIVIERLNFDSEFSPSVDDPFSSGKDFCILNNETERSIEMAPSEFCKEQIRRISCRIETNKNFFPRFLPRFCPLTNEKSGRFVGCSLKNFESNQTKINSSRFCVDFCLKNNVEFSEFQISTGFCKCSSILANEKDFIVDEKFCQKSSNDPIFVYRTGFKSFGNHLEKKSSKQNRTSISIVFFLTVGGRKNLRQIQRLIRSIYSRQHFYLIHVDKRENFLFEQISNFVRRSTNIVMARHRFSTVWGSSTLLDAHLAAFRQIFDELKWNFSFVLNLSETDFPLKPIGVLANFLSMYQSYNFLRTHNRDPFKFFKSQGVFQTFYQCENFMYRIGARELIENIIYDGGSDWYVLNREFVSYVTFADDPLINGLRHIFNYSLLPCEMFFHTAISNSHFCDSYIRNNFRLVHWNRERGCNCQHKNVVDWCGCSPLVYRINDKKLLNETIDKPLFFARKFDPTIDEQIIDWLENRISRRNFSQDSFYLQNLFHFHDQNHSLGEIFKFLDAFVRTKLIENETKDRPCLDRFTYRFQQVHAVYKQAEFQGYSFEYEFSNEFSYEIFLRLNQLESNRTESVKRFEIGLDFDKKELIFLDRSRTFLEPKQIKVLIEWNSKPTTNSTKLIIRDPKGNFMQRIDVFSSESLLIVDILFPQALSPSLIGIWQIAIVRNENEETIGSLNFLLLSSDENRWLNVEYLSILKNFWSIVDFCSTEIVRSQCNFLLNAELCSEKTWSYSHSMI